MNPGIVIEQATGLTSEMRLEIQAYLASSSVGGQAGGEHDPRWLDVLHQALGHRPYCLLARDAQRQIVGYLPLAYVSSLLFGRFLVSLPYLNRAGVVSSDTHVAAALLDHACDLADQLGVQYLELRHGSPIEHARLNACRDEKVRMVLELPSDESALWQVIDAKVRNQIRKGDKSDLSFFIGGVECLDDFYHVFAVNMRDLGTPVYGKRLFERILKEFPERAELVVVRTPVQPVAAALLIHDPPMAHGQPAMTQVPSASSLRRFNATNCNMWMYHRLLLRAMERGSRRFDFGRSSVDSGTYRFKKQWGAQPQPTLWQYYLRQGTLDSARPDNPKYRRKIQAWQKLPVWITRIIGPGIVRGVP